MTDTVLQPQQNYLTRSRDNLKILAHNFTLYQHSLCYLGPKTWNAVPQQFKDKNKKTSTCLQETVYRVYPITLLKAYMYIFIGKVCRCAVYMCSVCYQMCSLIIVFNILVITRRTLTWIRLIVIKNGSYVCYYVYD